MNKIKNLSRVQKSLIALFADSMIALIALIISFFVQGQQNIFFYQPFGTHIFLISILSIILSARLFNIHKIVLRGFSLNQVFSLFIYSIGNSTFLLLFLILYFQFSITRDLSLNAEILNNDYLTNVIIFTALFFVGALFIRLFYINILSRIYSDSDLERKKIVIFGAGNAGIQLMRSFENEYPGSFICFIDDNPNLRNTVISGVRVLSRKDFEKFIILNKVDEIWVAIPSLSVIKLEEIVSYLSNFSNKILSLPEINNLRFNSSFKSRLSEANINNFLGRDAIHIKEEIYHQCYKNKNILVTGAGGSIGSELSLQIIKLKPKTIVLFELNELALYNIERKIKSLDEAKSVNIISCLGSVSDINRIKNILQNYSIQVILHAAAYKHVSLVEENIIEGFKNNVIGTFNLISSVKDSDVERFVLVSSDKAVRPTNIMGATKRLAEIITQHTATKIEDLNFSIVRFGNVIGSSGSVIPLFMSQINNGGPVTVTDPNMTRYFMAIPEAAKLILIAGSYGKKAEIFLLDMGKPIKIIDLAKNMIFLSGNKIKSEINQDEGIEIKIINKMPGEKIEEELLIDGKIKNTGHKKVMVLDETKIIDFPLDELIYDIRMAIDKQDKNIIKNILNKYLREYKPSE